MKQQGGLFNDLADCFKTFALGSLKHLEKDHFHAGQFDSGTGSPLNAQGFVCGCSAADAVGNNVDAKTRPGQVYRGLIDTDMGLDSREKHLGTRGILKLLSESTVAVAAKNGFRERSAARQQGRYFTKRRSQPARVLLGNNDRYIEHFTSLYQTQQIFQQLIVVVDDAEKRTLHVNNYQDRIT